MNYNILLIDYLPEIFLLLILVPLIKIKDLKVLFFFIGFIIICLIKNIFSNAIINFENAKPIFDILFSTSIIFFFRLNSKNIKKDFFYYQINIVLLLFFIINKNFKIIELPYFINLYLLASADIIYIFSVINKKRSDSSLFNKIIIENNYILSAFLFLRYLILTFNKNTVLYNYFIVLQYFLLVYLISYYYYKYISDQKLKIKTYDKEKDGLLSFFGNIIKNFSYPFHLHYVTDMIIENCISKSKASAGAIYLINENENSLIKYSAAGKFYFKDKINISENKNSILIESFSDKKDIFIKKSIDKNFFKTTFENEAQISSFISIPLITNNKSIGVLTLINENIKFSFSDDNFSYLKLFAEYAVASIENLFSIIELIEKNEIEKEIKIASFIQKRIILNKIPSYPNLSISAFSNSIKGINSDYLNIIPLKNNKYAAVIIDVAGKGINAVMILLIISSLLKLCLSINDNTARILTMINKILTESFNFENYATCGLLIIDSENNQVSFSNAAQSPLIIFKNKSKKFIEIDTEGLPLGIDKAGKYIQKNTSIESGDILILTTDGVIESIDKSGNQYSKKRLLNLICANHTSDASLIIQKIKDDIKLFSNNATQKDEQSVILFKIS